MPLDATTGGVVLLASEGRAFSRTSIEAASSHGACVVVLAIVRIWGTALGLPNPWLMPSKREWEAQRRSVASAITALEARGTIAKGRVVATRQPARVILREAKAAGARRVVMGADEPRHWFAAGLMWSQEPQRVARRVRRAGVEMVLVAEDMARA